MERTNTAAGLLLATTIGLLAHGLGEVDLMNQNDVREEEKASGNQVDDSEEDVMIGNDADDKPHDQPDGI
jgi:hypothetical protein